MRVCVLCTCVHLACVQVAQEAQSAAHKWQLDAEDSRKSALAMALQLKRCVSDLEEAQKQLASQEKVTSRP